MSLLPEKKSNSIWACAQDGNLQGVMDCVEKQNKEVNSLDEDKRTALHWAAANGKELIVTYLIGKGANPDTEDESGWTPLMSASSTGHEAVVKTLLETDKVNVNKTNDTGATSLHYAAGKGFLPIVNLLLAKGAKLGITNKYGETPLHRAVACSNPKKTKEADIIVEVLISKGADISVQNKQKQTVLHIAVVEGKDNLVKKFIQMGLDVLQEDSDGKNSLELCTNEEIRAQMITLAKSVSKRTPSDMDI